MRSIALCLLFCFALDAVASAQPTRPEIAVPFINTALHPITIDGEGADWPAAAKAAAIHFYKGDGHAGTPQALGTTVVQTMTDRQDGETTVSLTHDGEHLFVLATIHDDLLEQRPGENNSNFGWMEDALHIYIDSTNAGHANIENPPISNQVGYEQFGVSTDLNCYTENCDFTTQNTAGAAGPGAQPDQLNWIVAVRVSGTGPFTYVFEERMPLREVAGHNLRTMMPGQTYGFDAEFVDSDAGVYPQGWVFWSSNGSTDAWNSQNLWGRMILEPIQNSTGWTWTLIH